MDISRRDQPRKDIVALVRWSKKPGENPVFKFIMTSILGLILCLFLMIFLPFLRIFSVPCVIHPLFRRASDGAHGHGPTPLHAGADQEDQ